MQDQSGLVFESLRLDLRDESRRSPDAERRHLTVLFCDVVDSTRLAGQLDPEEYWDVIQAYHTACAEVIQYYDGYIAQYLGDGVLVYFGYPRAHEDDAQRAVRTGLELVEAMKTINARVPEHLNTSLAIRVGIHTGVVVIDTPSGAERQEALALGEVPNIAARLQGLAMPNEVVMSAHTLQLVGGVFDVEELVTSELKGLKIPLRAYRARGESTAESRFEAAMLFAALTPLVDRDEEIGLLLHCWEQAKASEGQVVLLVGEPGIGKSRLVQTLGERQASEQALWLRYQCLPYFQHRPFNPIITQLERAAQLTRDDTPTQKLDKLEAWLEQSATPVTDTAALFAALLAIPSDGRYPTLDLAPQGQKARTIEALADQALSLAKQASVVCLVEDIHWCDPSSLEVFESIINQVPDARILMVLTARPGFEASWSAAAHVTMMALNRLSRAQSTAMVDRLTVGKTLPPEVLCRILAKADGVPLFVEELTKTIFASDLLTAVGDHYVLSGPLPSMAIPATLRDALTARLDQLASVKEVAQIGSVIGREFSYALLAAVAAMPADALADALHQLVTAGMICRRGQPPEARYRFTRALVHEAAYELLLKSKRQELHTRVATVLAEQFAETSDA